MSDQVNMSIRESTDRYNKLLDLITSAPSPSLALEHAIHKATEAELAQLRAQLTPRDQEIARLRADIQEIERIYNANKIHAIGYVNATKCLARLA